MHQCCLPHPGLGKGSVRVGRNSFRIRAVTHFADDAHSSRCPASFGPAGPVTGCTTVRRHIGGADESPQPEISPASEVTERPSVVVIQRNAQQDSTSSHVTPYFGHRHRRGQEPVVTRAYTLCLLVIDRQRTWTRREGALVP